MGHCSDPSECSTLVDLLDYRAATQPDRLGYTFLQDGTTATDSLTYVELHRQAQAIAATLQAANLTGERALLLYPPGLDFVAAFFGCLFAGVLPVPAYPPRRNQKIQRLRAIISDACPQAVLTNTAALVAITGHFTENPELASLRVVTTDTTDDGAGAAGHAPAVGRDDLAFLQYTSGSTSTPKGVMVSHGNLLHNSECIRRAMELTPDSVSVTWLPSYHDMGLIDGIIQALYTGFPAYLMAPASFLQNPIRWLQAVSDYRATHSGGPNFAYELCVRKTTTEQRETLDLSCWTTAYNGAEPVRQSTLQEFSTAFEPCGFQARFFYPCYGLAEATLMVTGGLPDDPPVYCEVEAHQLEQHRVVDAHAHSEKASLLVGCGRVHLGTRVLIVDPQSRMPCAPDRIGEVWVAGPSVVQGYWHRPEQTEETFQSRLADTGEGPFLRTGDLGLVRDGELFLTGRLKDVIIIRGRNHYPQDIELTAEQSHPALRAGCGAAFAVTVGGVEQLVLVQEVERSYLHRLSVEETAGAIRQAVAEHHELQTYAVVLLRPGKIPKTSSGKIQRGACRAEFLAGTLEPVGESVLAPEEQVWDEPPLTREEIFSSPVETRASRVADYLRHVVSQVLKVSLSGRDLQQPLVRLGIDSLAAIELQHRLEHELGVVLSPADFLAGISLEQVGRRVLGMLEDAALRAQSPPLTETRRATEQPLSRGQQALWFLHQVAPESAAYNVSFAVRVLAGLDVERLRKALGLLVMRHPALRTTFASASGQPVQRIREQAAPDFELADARGWSSDQVERRLGEWSHRPFDLGGGPLLRVRLCRTGESEYVLLLTAHHIVVDFWSLLILLDELTKIYASLEAQRSFYLPPPGSEPAEHAAWQTELLQGPGGERLWDYWRKQLAGAPAVLSLPTDRPRPATQSFRGAVHVSHLDEGLVEGLRGLAKAQGVTFFMLLLAAYQTLLHRYTGQQDILVGTSVAGRSRSQFANAVGYFVNQVVLRADLSGNPRFDEFLGRVKETVLGALAHQDYPFSLLVERLQPARDASHSPLFQTMFVVEKPHRLQEVASLVRGDPGASVNLGGLRFASVPLERRAAQFDLTLTVFDGERGLAASWEYNRDLFDPDTISRLSGHFRTLLEAILKHPHRPLTQLPLLGAAEQRQMLVEWNRTQTPYPGDACLHTLFESQAARTPDATALVSAGQSLSYRELNRRANQLAHHLRRSGIRPEARVGVCLERSPEMVVALLAVLKAGGAYVPLDASYPKQRLAFMIDDAQAELLLTQRHLAAELPAGKARLICLDADWEEVAREGDENPASPVSAENLAYVIYTSGSTGNPKGTMVPHRGVVNYLSWCTAAYKVADGSGAPVNTSIGFDATITSLFSPLLVGKQVVLLPERDELAALVDVLSTEGDFSLVKITPAHLELLSYSMPDGRAEGRTRALVVGGEALLSSSLTFWQTHAPATRIINEYGPTEAVVGCCVYEAQAEPTASGLVPIGRPIANTRLYIVDAEMQPVPVGVMGELYIGGAGVARGYLNRPSLTAARFVCDPFGAEPGARLYRTGDVARYLAEGTIEFLGRRDDQVKIRGFRIELGEIEAVLLQHPDVREAAVVVSHEGRNDLRLAAYVVRRPGPVTATDLRNYLAERLPRYMLPASFVWLPELPLTANGKVDKRALPRPPHLRDDAEAACVPPTTKLESVIAAAWQEVLHLDKVGVHDNFFDVGGHSLLAVQLHHKLREGLKRDVPVVELLQHPTVSSLARHLSRDHEEPSDYGQIHDRVQKQKGVMAFRRQMMRGRQSASTLETAEEPR